jgi:CheY-like chemotaxis protein
MKKLKGLNCILLVDDDDVNNYLNKLLIEKSGIDVHVEIALNGLIALEYLTSTGRYKENNTFPKPGIIFLDINMPRMNGWEFLDEYNKLDDNQKGKIVIAMLTSSNNTDDLNTALKEYRLSEYIFKPLTLKKLEEVIYNHFPEEEG